jgi:hypothetical protein
MNSTSPHPKLLEAIATLSDRDATLTLQFIQTLTSQPHPSEISSSPDPLADFIGANHHGNLANAIDDALYVELGFELVP